MYDYHLTQWLLFFFIYCFFGWIWESCYVSAKQRKWVNRGFLHGPLIPIYGFGAIAVLFAAIPVRTSPVLVYITGLIAATLLEYVTGAVMEHLFKVRYWDYSDKPLNLHGYICLVSSLAWGAFSVLLIRFVHTPIEHLVLKLPASLTEALAFAVLTLFAIDATQSFNEAMDLREIIERLTESNQEIKRIQKRMDVIAAVLDADIKESKQKAGEFRKRLDGRLAAEKRIHELLDTIGLYLEHTKKKPVEATQGIRGELGRFQESLKKQQQKIGTVRNRQYIRSARLLRRNPGAISHTYREALEEIRQNTKRNTE